MPRLMFIKLKRGGLETKFLDIEGRSHDCLTFSSYGEW